ncbi:DNA repair protein RecO [marine gamma proteobacterium HTCC2143]|jgi:DNA repair protein RecO (recombination protein O)|uniref:DNA repair protein RecO n=1 Tax=marine gamma proteobacterium HTCC2143 TaxID=247633 RepID=A0YCJ9_9GAMM|nr:DNA repair protein RecO [marine gamma proteobacterium HTCC2143]
MRIESQPAYILHTRNFRDSSLIVDFLSADYGRVSGVVKGVRATSKSAKQRRGLSQPFVPLLISWSGKSDLKTIIQMEPRGAPLQLQGKRLFSGLYVNELLSRLLQQDDQHTAIYTLYEWIAKCLVGDSEIDIVLRQFELQLMEYLGYGLDFTQEAETDNPIIPDRYYVYRAGEGLFAVPDAELASRGHLVNRTFQGEDLLAIASGAFTDNARHVAKLICRQALRLHLGEKPLKSRELFH